MREGARRHANRDAQTALAAWWLTVPIGIMVGFEEMLTDPIWFSALSWAGSALLSYGLAWLRRRRGAMPAASEESTA